jgi:undecaprenyl-diphosphatase
LALVPGMSRSGATISGGLLSGLSREAAVRFSFLLSLPIIFGSGLYKVYDLIKLGQFGSMESSLIIASIFAFISGLLAIHFLIKFLRKYSLNYFGVYRIILAVVIFIYL